MAQVSVKAWGNSQGIRIPKDILEKLNIHVSDVLQLEIEGDRIVLVKAFKHRTFEERLAEYGGEISVIDYDWGDPAVRNCRRVDSIPYHEIMNVSDALQGIFEYD